jgi:hypothetical protein
MVDKTSSSGTHGAEAREWWRDNRTADIKQIAEHYGLSIRQLTPYQYRVAEAVDFYPTNGRVHFLKTNRWGDYHTARDAARICEKL